MDHGHLISITVQSGRGSYQASFPQQTKVREVIELAAAKLGYPAGGNYVLVRLKTELELDGERPLVSYQIEDGEKLVLSETGSGV